MEEIRRAAAAFVDSSVEVERSHFSPSWEAFFQGIADGSGLNLGVIAALESAGELLCIIGTHCRSHGGRARRVATGSSIHFR